MFRNVSDYENGSQFTIGGRVCPVLSPEISAPDPATKATGIVATRLSGQLENSNLTAGLPAFGITQGSAGRASFGLTVACPLECT